MVESVDDSTGMLLEALEETGTLDRTVIIFTSDNGGLDRNGGPTENAPLRSGKGYSYEGGIRVPFIIRWPQIALAGKVSDSPVCSIDLFPTILEAAGQKLPSDREIDGVSLVSHLKSGGANAVKRDHLLWHFPHYRHDPGPYSIIRQGEFKLIKFWEGSHELYNLEDDLGEENNLASSMPEKVQQLEKLLLERLGETEARLPRDNPDWAPKTGKS